MSDARVRDLERAAELDPSLARAALAARDRAREVFLPVLMAGAHDCDLCGGYGVLRSPMRYPGDDRECRCVSLVAYIRRRRLRPHADPIPRSPHPYSTLGRELVTGAIVSAVPVGLPSWAYP